MKSLELFETRPLEKTLWERGIKRLAGVDEAGRGCLAGPVIAAAVILPPYFHIEGLTDSKKLSPAQRETLLEQIQDQAIAIGIGQCSPEEIDTLNILWAAMEAMKRAVDQLPVPPEHLLIDGNYCYPECPYPYHTLVKGDLRSQPIAAASIVAKVTRDRLMQTLHEQYPQYNWAQNKGYPTSAHYEALKKYGPSPLHRTSFRLTRS